MIEPIESILHVENFQNGLPPMYTGVIYNQELREYCWLLKGCFHRIDGPAIIGLGGYQEWFVRGRSCNSQEEWFERLTAEEKEIAVWNMNNW